jgi:hypothetical protein
LSHLLSFLILQSLLENSIFLKNPDTFQMAYKNIHVPPGGTVTAGNRSPTTLLLQPCDLVCPEAVPGRITTEINSGRHAHALAV